jgi:predicted KAP-like P-loop ATPase
MAVRGDAAETTANSLQGKESREALRTLSDKPLEDDADDRLDFVAYADALAELLDHPATDTPLTIAISAQWGAGKTSLAKMIEGRLKRWPLQRGDPPHITCWFNAWMHDDAPHLGAAFAAEVAKTAGRCRPMWRRPISWLRIG